MENKTIWIDHKAMWKPEIFSFRNGIITFYIEEYELFAQLWITEHFGEPLHLIGTVEIFEHEIINVAYITERIKNG